MTTRIQTDSLVKTFSRARSQHTTALQFILDRFTGSSKEQFSAVDQVSFEATQGEKVGIIGSNGSGKSTFLRCLAGIYRPNSGTVSTQGTLVYLNGFNQGLNPRLTMRDNILLIGSLRGLSRKTINERFDEIVDFSGLREYVDVRVKDFSDGMRMRLNFSAGILSLAYHDPDILLLDEVTLGAGGGDIVFQEKTRTKMRELVQGGATVVYVSHNLDSIIENCDRVLWMEKGKIQKEGLPEEVIDGYKKAQIS